MLARLDEVKSEKLRASLLSSADAVRRNLELVGLRAVPCEFVPDRLAVQPPDREQLRSLFRLWGFNGLLAELDALPVERQAELI